MSENHGDQHSDSIGFERMVFFSDAVLAIAITLMALEIRIPEIDPVGAADEIPLVLQSMIPHIIVYCLSFMVIGTYWVLHHRLFRLIRRYDNRVLWLNIVFLLFIGFMPVSTNALGNYPEYPQITVLYAGSLAAVGLAELVVWLYASIGNRLISTPVTERFKLYITLRILIPPLTFLASIPIAPFDNRFAQLFWAAQIPLFFALRAMFPKEHELRRVFETTS